MEKLSPPDLWQIINRQDDGDIELIATLPPLPIDELISVAYPAMLLRLAADVVGKDNELAWRLVARARAVASYKWKQQRLRGLING
jgi:hypothetical protein